MPAATASRCLLCTMPASEADALPAAAGAMDAAADCPSTRQRACRGRRGGGRGGCGGMQRLVATCITRTCTRNAQPRLRSARSLAHSIAPATCGHQSSNISRVCGGAKAVRQRGRHSTPSANQDSRSSTCYHAPWPRTGVSGARRRTKRGPRRDWPWQPCRLREWRGERGGNRRRYQTPPPRRRRVPRTRTWLKRARGGGWRLHQHR